MMAIFGILIYGLLIWCFFSPRVRNMVRDRVAEAWTYTQLGAIIGYDAMVAFLYGVARLILIDVAILIVVVAIGNPWLLVFFFITNAIVSFVPMYVLWLLQQSMAAAGDQIRWLGDKLKGLPLALFPFRLVGECVLAIGWVVEQSVALARWMVGLLVQVTLISLFLTGLALLDLEMGWHIINLFTLLLAGLLWMTVVSIQVLQQIHPRRSGMIKILGILTIVILLVIGVFHYVEWLPFWRGLNVYVLYWPLALCILLSVAMVSLIKFGGSQSSGGHGATTPTNPVRQALRLVVALGFIWMLLFPWLKAGEPPYLWTQRLVNFQFSRLHNVNTVQARTETDPLVAKAERDGQLPADLNSLDAAFLPSADRAATLVKKENAWDARAAGRVPVIPEAVVRGNQHAWVTMAPAFEPLHVTVPVEDRIKPYASSPLESGPDGIFPEGLPKPYDRDMTVLMKERRDMGSQQVAPGNLFELIGRVCNGGVCTPAMPMGPDSVICPNPGGHLQAWHNGRVVIDGVPTVMAFNNGVGYYRLTIVPDELARKVCADNPGSTFVKIKKGGSQ